MKNLFVLPWLVLMTCCHPKSYKSEKAESQTCMTLKTEEFSKRECKNGSSVKEYLLNGRHVFVFDPGNCGADMTSEVLDDKCSSLGFLGGIMGNTNINGIDFSKAEYLKTVWESPSY